MNEAEHDCQGCQFPIRAGEPYIATGTMNEMLRHYHTRCAPPLVPIEVSGEVNTQDRAFSG